MERMPSSLQPPKAVAVTATTPVTLSLSTFIILAVKVSAAPLNCNRLAANFREKGHRRRWKEKEEEEE